MCGICGYLDARAATGQDELLATVAAMAATMPHRGPDDQGVWAEARTGVALGQCRLSIIDLSPQGHQPMVSADGRWVTVYNGEAYNFAEVRAELEAQVGPLPWRGHSDTEVLLECVARWGVETTLKRLNGMFALALWDRREKLLFLARDRVGKKPLYYGWQDKHFLFGSELKALVAHPAFGADIDRGALSLYLRHNYVPGPHSIYEGIRKLTPGTWLVIDAKRPGQTPEPRPYWSAREMAEKGAAQPLDISEDQAADLLEETLTDAVRLRMISDVPLGAFLSGGVDSSLVVALMRKVACAPVKTFSIGFPEAAFDEAPHAAAVARHLGTAHRELYVTWEDALAVVPKLPAMFDEPFADSSQIPTFLVSRMARREVTVSLSGDGGDELFCGYDRYFLGERIWRGLSRLPAPLRAAGSRILAATPPSAWDRLFARCGWLLPRGLRWKNPGERMADLGQILESGSAEDFYRGLVSHFKHPAALVLGGHEPPTALTDSERWAELPDFTMRMMFLDLISYLPDDILVKVDRCSMAVSLEARAPLLDARVVELAWRLPMRFKAQGGEGKRLLRRVLYRHVPQELIERPKMGFGVPLEHWLRGPLKDWAEALLDESQLKSQGFFHPSPIRLMWQEHLSGTRAWHYYLWDLLMFQAWLAEQRSRV
jgi:asparagine synthase (glutamine-hydrolysing)